ncbi:molybdopterin oxidoreductase family protein [Nocardia asteroides]|uniref:molybdopterin oxidoreductase family protein n=1 Tax=Nocardia asteroides TaxID=1824 RepID=UPI00037004AC|nr:Molybdopterin oxidoreductase [Nocardia asteroides]VEG35060.1 Nitrate reductase [Nocardia asteroides]
MPTAQNTRECGADGDIAGFRNWANDTHLAQLAELWNVERERITHDSAPTHAMQMIDNAEQGTLRMLWVSATNPAASLPDLGRIRSILGRDSLFLVVQDIFPTETTALADVVLPAAAWGEKTGCFTNADRTVHLSDTAVEPPGAARPDLDIFLDFAHRMGFRDKDGAPLVSWDDAEGAFEAWKRCSAGRPCDYTGLTYAALRGGSGIQWPCTAEHPAGTERLYADGRFWSDPDYCESYGKDLITGEPYDAAAYRRTDPAGRAMLKSAHYLPASERPDTEFPFALITGRTLYHFHTRTKTARAAQLDAAAPQVWVEMSEDDADRLTIGEGDLLEVQTRRGAVRAHARISGIRPGVLFLPFHYGYWDTGGDHDRAANELTRTEWDPASKQPLFKTAAACVRKLAASSGPAPAPTVGAAAPVGGGVAETMGGPAASVEEDTGDDVTRPV